jgi:membrane protein
MGTRTIGCLSISVIRAAFRHRTNAHAAEMAFFGLLSLVPATITMGGILHVFARVGGPELATRGQDGAMAAIRLLIGPKLADSVINPFVQTQLSQSRGLAITGLIVTTWLTSRIFYALSHALDAAFSVSDPRRSLIQRCVSLVHAVGVVFIMAITLAVMVLGWRSGSAGMDRFLGRVPVVAQLWAVIRWPLLIAVLLGVIIALYRYGPNIKLSWRECLPGAALAVLLWIAAAVAFRAYLLVGAGAPTGVKSSNPNVVLIGRAIGASIGTGIWMYFSALAILTGAELNGVLLRHEASETELSPADYYRSLRRSLRNAHPVRAALTFAHGFAQRHPRPHLHMSPRPRRPQDRHVPQATADSAAPGNHAASRRGAAG